ncbi:hypothetical protein M404DRAFT_1007643 [Pisolithus tinctorius Marx 270]|uniref:Uncharacterized protein n=1 Tax=Pisolithus tinctorius Marx 270 TaxID=870435 RepID=A0A0C3N2U9_PISTI|nr:hypothetical protein M404DRAFT_1007643 [Pisolithus tinctorius Marx 270]
MSVYTGAWSTRSFCIRGTVFILMSSERRRRRSCNVQKCSHRYTTAADSCCLPFTRKLGVKATHAHSQKTIIECSHWHKVSEAPT